MQQAIQITFRNLDHSDAIESAVREKANKLEEFFDHIISCQTVIESPHKHHQKGRHYQVKISLSVPGKDIVVRRAPDKHDAHEDPYVAIRDAFDAAKRQLRDYVARMKNHNVPDELRNSQSLTDTTII